ncbi:hypothetical protein [Isoalcanivorax pacificus]|uniref:hypothetical protein n=1 Tax=Isoalcanivorax pacificus TaxID=1306787 RepID=UPI0011864B45|nr:hypothetical protein [Isoalcanivorax pacificus]
MQQKQNGCKQATAMHNAASDVYFFAGKPLTQQCFQIKCAHQNATASLRKPGNIILPFIYFYYALHARMNSKKVNAKEGRRLSSGGMVDGCPRSQPDDRAQRRDDRLATFAAISSGTSVPLS